MSLGPLVFGAPTLLLALLALPILWLLLRAVPPAPIIHVFPAVGLLLGLKDKESSAARTPWWLLVLRMLAVAAVIIGLAAPVLPPQTQGAGQGSGRLLITMDASWASAADWPQRHTYLETVLQQAAQAGRPVALLRLSAPEAVVFQTAQDLAQGLAGIMPESWEPVDRARIASVLPEGNFETLWLSDGLARQAREDVLELLQSRGPVHVAEGESPLFGLALQASSGDQTVKLLVKRLRSFSTAEVTLQAFGFDPAGQERVLEERVVQFEPAATEAAVDFDMPAELQARVSRFQIKGQNHAGAVVLSDDSLRKRAVGLVDSRQSREGLELLSPLHYLEKALVASTKLHLGSLDVLLPGNPDVMILADVAELTDVDEQALLAWTEAGGLLVRFAGPKLAASDVSRGEEHPLMPVRLRAGGRFVGGAMSWGAPKTLAPFERNSPFFGLNVDDSLLVSAQVMAQPDPQLSERVIAWLSDGTPLVTRKGVGRGSVVLFHISANAEWSNVPLSGLFVRMLERLAVANSRASLEMSELEGTIWKPVRTLDGFGRLKEAGALSGVAGPDLLGAALSAEMPPGLYEGLGRRMARNVLEENRAFDRVIWPSDMRQTGFSGAKERALGGAVFAFGLLVLAADILATLLLSGRLLRPVLAGIFGLLLALAPPEAGQAEEQALSAAGDLVLAHVLTGNAKIDEVALAGLAGLSDTLFFRTSVEPNAPQSVDLEGDDLAFYPILYWPVSPDQPTPSDAAYAKLNAYLRAGGLILFDTRDSDVARFGTASVEGRALRRLAAALDIPELEPVPQDHVLTRSFYLLQDFPGRHPGRDVWVEAAPKEAARAEGMPFRNLNDGVTPVVIGGNDWAAAWAIDARGAPLLPVGRGLSGERQRELAYRFGVNLVMHVLTGNYKSDQVHVPALLERLGQ
jgi:hypothetical protein